MVCDEYGEYEFNCVDNGVGPVLFCEECCAGEEYDSGGEKPIEEPHGFSGGKCFSEYDCEVEAYESPCVVCDEIDLFAWK